MSDTENKMLTAITKYIEKQGWKVVIIGGCSIHQQPSDLKYNYEFVVRFTGKKINGDS